MKVSELINRLQKYNGEMEVIISVDCKENFKEYGINNEFCIGLSKTDKSHCLIIQADEVNK